MVMPGKCLFLIFLVASQVLFLSCRRGERPSQSAPEQVESVPDKVLPLAGHDWPKAHHFVVVLETSEAQGEVVLNMGDTPGDYAVDWDNNGTFEAQSAKGTLRHRYGKPGAYTVRLAGIIPHLMLCADGAAPLKPLAQEVLDIPQWGMVSWQSMRAMFAMCDKLEQWSATDSPSLSQVTTMSDMFSEAAIFNQPLDSWDVSQVTDMGNMFSGASKFNQPLDSWDVSRVTDMNGMFSIAWEFNQPLNSWDVSQVTDTNWMFYGTRAFNQPLDAWNVSRVTNMSDMFSGTWEFNQPLNTWDVSQVTNMSRMFSGASEFNQPLDAWDVSRVTDMSDMLKDTPLEASSENYEVTLKAWRDTGIKPDVLKNVR
jgi:surface protein